MRKEFVEDLVPKLFRMKHLDIVGQFSEGNLNEKARKTTTSYDLWDHLGPSVHLLWVLDTDHNKSSER